MMDFNETGLPASVFKAFATYRTNAKDFAEKSGLGEDYPVQVAQTIAAANPNDTASMQLALLMSVPEAAWSVMEKRFGRETVEALDEAWKHVRTGYAYIGEANDDVKALALAAACVTFDKFCETATNTGSIMTAMQSGQDPRAAVRKIMMPEARMFEKIGNEDAIDLFSIPALGDLYREKLNAYKDARKEQNEALAEMGVRIMGAAGSDDDENVLTPSERPTFEDTGLPDDPAVRGAYGFLCRDARVDPGRFTDALTVGKLLADGGDAVTVAAGLVDAALPRLGPDDYGFLEKKLDPGVIDIISKYCISDVLMGDQGPMVYGPDSVKQIAIARGIITLDNARKQSENLLNMLEARAGMIPPGAEQQLRAESLAPAEYVSNMVPLMLKPAFGNSGAPKLEKIFAEKMQALDEMLGEQMTSMQQQDALSPKAPMKRIQLKPKPFGPSNFGH